MIEFSSLKEMAKALAKLQADTKNPVKNAKSHNNRYANLEGLLDAIKPALAKHEFSLIQSGYNDGDIFGVETLLLHSSGEYVRARFGSPITDTRLKGSQAIGSQITYYRRYSITSILNLAAEDDDGNAASGSASPSLATDGQKSFLKSLMGLEEYNKHRVFIEKEMTKAQAAKKIEELNKKGDKQ